MGIHTMYAPQLGEGIKALKVVAILKSAGESVKKDEPILEVETEKATMEIESPVDGILHQLLVQTSAVIPVGQEMLSIRLNEAGLISCGAVSKEERIEEPAQASPRKPLYSDRELPLRQQALIRNMQVEGPIAALVETSIKAKVIQDLKKKFRAMATGGVEVPSLTEIVAWAVLKTMHQHPRLRSLLLDDQVTIREYAHSAIGIAVSLPNEELTTMQIKGEECPDFRTFCSIYKSRLTQVREGQEVSGPHSIAISDLAAFHIHSATPLIISPSVATLCIGISPDRSFYNFSFVFDHRIINGATAARFLNDVKKSIEKLTPILRQEKRKLAA